MSVTEIARKANVSIGTVDRVIHNRGRVSKQTKEIILKIIAEMNYTPNIFARNLSLGRTFLFGVLMPKLSQDSSYWRIPAKGILNAEKELASHKVEVIFFHYDRYSEKSFEKAFREMIAHKLDGLLIAPVLSATTSKLLREIPEKLPYAFFDTTIPGSPFLSCVRQDSYQSGRLAAKLMNMLIQKPGLVVIIKVFPEDYHINERTKGFLSYNSRYKKLTAKIYNADSENAAEGFEYLTARIIDENPDLKGIFITNAWTHPVARHIEKMGLAKNISIIGYDLIPKNIYYLKKDVINFLINQRPEMQGYLSVYALYRHVVLKEKINKRIMVPLEIVTRENVKYHED